MTSTYCVNQHCNVFKTPEVLAHGDVYEGVDDGVDEGEEEEDDAIVVDRVGELEEAQLQQSLHNKPGKHRYCQVFKKVDLGPQQSRKSATTRSNILII